MGIPTVADALAAVQSCGLPCVNGVWPNRQAPPLPYAMLERQESYGQTGSGKALFRVQHYNIELYSRKVDVGLIKRVQAALDGAGILAGDRTEWSEESTYCVTYFMTTLLEQEA